MPRRIPVKNSFQAIGEAINTEPKQSIKNFVGTINVDAFKYRMAEALGEEGGIVFAWDVIPDEHEALAKSVLHELEAEGSVKRLGSTSEPQPESISASEENVHHQDIPLIEEKAKRRSRRSTALTETKEATIQQERVADQGVKTGLSDALAMLQGQLGAVDAANAGTAYLTAFTANLNNVKGQGLTIFAAETLQQIAKSKDFNPAELCQQLGIPISAETQELLKTAMAETLGKAQEAKDQITTTAWGNGIHLENELSQLSDLLNSND